MELFVDNKKQVNFILTTVILFLILVILNKCMTTFNHNEHMYVTAGYLISKGYSQYSDFAYLQTPLLPLIYGNLFFLFDFTDLLTVSKFFTYFIFLAYGWIVYLFAKELIRDKTYQYLIVVIFLLNTTIVFAARDSSNYMLAAFFSLLSYYCLVKYLGKKSTYIGIFLSGMFATLAVSTKLYYVVTIPPLLFVAMVYPLTIDFRSRLKSAIFPISIGLIVGMIPILYYLFTMKDLFLFNNIQYHLLTTKWRIETDFSEGMSWLSKMELARNEFFNYDTLLLLFGSLLFLGIHFQMEVRQNRSLSLKKLPFQIILAFLLSIITALTILMFTPLLLNYFAMPVTFFLLLFISSFAILKQRGPILNLFLLTLVTFQFVYSIPELLLVNSKWVGHEIHTDALRIRDTGNLKPGDKIATLAPLYAIESGLDIYPELSTGSFLFRVGDMLDKSLREKYKATSPNSIAKELFKNDPPAAILVGFEGDLDDPLREYAINNHYIKISEDFNGGELYIKP